MINVSKHLPSLHVIDLE